MVDDPSSGIANVATNAMGLAITGAVSLGVLGMATKMVDSLDKQTSRRSPSRRAPAKRAPARKQSRGSTKRCSHCGKPRRR